MKIPDVGPLAILITLLIAATAKFYWAIRNHSWLSFADGMMRVGLAGLYLLTYINLLEGTSSGSDQARALTRIGILAIFAVESMDWIISLFRKGERK